MDESLDSGSSNLPDSTTHIHSENIVKRDWWGNPDWRYERCSCGYVRYYNDKDGWTDWEDWRDWDRLPRE